MRSKLHVRIFEVPYRIWAWVLIGMVSALLFALVPGQPGGMVGKAGFQGAVPEEFKSFVRQVDRARGGENPYFGPWERQPYPYSPAVLALGTFWVGGEQARLEKPGVTGADAGGGEDGDGARLEADWLTASRFCILALALALVLGSSYSRRRSVVCLMAGMVLAWPGVFEALRSGHLEFWILVLAVVSAVLLRPRPGGAGLALGLLPGLKLGTALLFLPYLLVMMSSHWNLYGKRSKRARHFMTGYLIGIVTWGAAAPSLVFGSDRARTLLELWYQQVVFAPQSLFISADNQSAWVSGMRWFETAPGIGLGLSAILLGLLLGVLIRRPMPALSEPWRWLAPWLLFLQLVHPISWKWGSLFLLGAPFAVWDRAADESPGVERSALRTATATACGVLWLIGVAAPALWSGNAANGLWVRVLESSPSFLWFLTALLAA